MSVYRIDPFASFDKVARRMNDFSNEFQNGVTIEKAGFNPRVDISEDDKNITFQVELAGLKKDEVNISVDKDNTLSITGQRLDKRETDDKTFHRKEISFGSFKRAFVLPDYADKDNISAKFDHGVLNISVGKKEAEQAKEINVEIK